MAGEIQIGGTTFATESGGTVTVSNVDSATNRQNLGLEIGVDVQSYDADTTKNDVANTFTANQIISVTDNTNAALRVTQLGTGNALVVEDETNPDSTPFVIDASGNVLVGKSSADESTAGFNAAYNGTISAVRSASVPCVLNRLTNDGDVVQFRQNSTTEGRITISGTTVTYNGGHLGRFSQLADNTRDESIVKGTVMSNLDQMAEWTNDGVTEDNEQLNCMKVSDVEGDIDVAGVFVNWDNDDDIYVNDMNIAMTGDMVIRIAQGTTVARGDLLMSAGDGTAKPQGDDIVRSKTIAKVTSTHISHTYEDGSYLVPCVLMAC